MNNGLAVMAGGKSIPVPLVNIGPVSAGSSAAQNVAETYTVTLVRGDRRTGMAQPITDASSGGTVFNKPLDNIGAKSVAMQNDLGVLGGDMAGFPNGRRPIDDVVDIELRVAMGVLLSPFDGSATDPDPASDASRQLHYTDGAEPNPANYLAGFPYLNTPLGGSPTSAND